MKPFNAIAILIGALVVASVAAILWRAATEEDIEDRRVRIVEDYLGQCQSMTRECYAMADAALHARKDCLDGRPGRRAMARGALIWLNAHVETHPLPLQDGMARAVAAVWPRCKS